MDALTYYDAWAAFKTVIDAGYSEITSLGEKPRDPEQCDSQGQWSVIECSMFLKRQNSTRYAS